MYNSDTDLLFPPRVIRTLQSLRGQEWQKMVQSAASAEDTSVERLAFMLAMVHLCGCITCNGDTFRALHGCTQCARLTIQRFKGTDEELLQQFDEPLREVKQHLKSQHNPKKLKVL